jgi:hypothetical protein
MEVAAAPVTEAETEAGKNKLCSRKGSSECVTKISLLNTKCYSCLFTLSNIVVVELADVHMRALTHADMH